MNKFLILAFIGLVVIAMASADDVDPDEKALKNGDKGQGEDVYSVDDNRWYNKKKDKDGRRCCQCGCNWSVCRGRDCRLRG